MSFNPTVTVLLPVYNGAKYLREAIDSIISQEYEDFELLIINDGSSDDSVDIIKEYKDTRIRFFNQENKGLPYTLNRGIALARGRYLARMDSDDISLPTRLGKQVEFMDDCVDVSICGTWVETFGEVASIWTYPVSSYDVKCGLIFRNVVAHPSVMMRLNSIRKIGVRYNESYRNAQDYDLWEMLSHHLNIANIPEVLTRYRITASSLSRSNKAQTDEVLEQVTRRILGRLGIEKNQGNISFHRNVGMFQVVGGKDVLQALESWLLTIQDSNRKCKVYPAHSLDEALAREWEFVLNKFNGYDWDLAGIVMNSPLSSFITPWSRFRLQVKASIEAFMELP